MKNLTKVILKNKTEHQEFKVPFSNKDWCNWNRFMAYLFEVGKKINIVRKYDDGSEENDVLIPGEVIEYDHYLIMLHILQKEEKEDEHI